MLQLKFLERKYCMEVVINRCYGGFGLSPEGEKYFLKLKGNGCYFYKRDYTSKEPKYDRVDNVEKDLTFTLLVTSTADLGNTTRDIPQNFYFCSYLLERDDPDLVKTVRELGSERASSSLAKLKIVEIPDGISYDIQDYDGIEWVAESHRTWN